MKKILFLLLLLALVGGAGAIQFGNEIHIPSISENSFKLMTNPELDSQFFLQFQLVDGNGTPLENYHSELKIADARGVLVYPDFGEPDIQFSDSNGFINYSFILPSCSAINQSYCFNLDQNYTVTVTGKNIYRQEFFTTTINSIETNWMGDTMRFTYANAQSIWIIACGIAFIIFIVSLIYVRKKGGNK